MHDYTDILRNFKRSQSISSNLSDYEQGGKQIFFQLVNTVSELVKYNAI